MGLGLAAWPLRVPQPAGVGKFKFCHVGKAEQLVSPGSA